MEIRDIDITRYKTMVKFRVGGAPVENLEKEKRKFLEPATTQSPKRQKLTAEFVPAQDNKHQALVECMSYTSQAIASIVSNGLSSSLLQQACDFHNAVMEEQKKLS